MSEFRELRCPCRRLGFGRKHPWRPEHRHPGCAGDCRDRGRILGLCPPGSGLTDSSQKVLVAARRRRRRAEDDPRVRRLDANRVGHAPGHEERLATREPYGLGPGEDGNAALEHPNCLGGGVSVQRRHEARRSGDGVFDKSRLHAVSFAHERTRCQADSLRLEVRITRGG